MIAGHSNGQPSRKIRDSTSSSIIDGGSGRESSVSVIHCAEPSRAKTAPNTLDATARNSTMLEVFIVLRQAFFRPSKVNRR